MVTQASTLIKAVNLSAVWLSVTLSITPWLFASLTLSVTRDCGGVFRASAISSSFAVLSSELLPTYFLCNFPATFLGVAELRYD